MSEARALAAAATAPTHAHGAGLAQARKPPLGKRNGRMGGGEELLPLPLPLPLAVTPSSRALEVPEDDPDGDQLRLLLTGRVRG